MADYFKWDPDEVDFYGDCSQTPFNSAQTQKTIKPTSGALSSSGHSQSSDDERPQSPAADNGTSAESFTGHDVCTPNRDKIESPGIKFRFIPGYTLKRKIRKFPGPLGLFTQTDEDDVPFNPKCFVDEHNITSQHFCLDESLFPSWEKLQAAVSSIPQLLSVAHFYSIHRIRQESSQVALPKHMLVPVLCVLIKKYKVDIYIDKTTLQFADDTGFVFGFIAEEVMKNYKEHICDGTAFVLKQVVFFANNLWLTMQSIVSIYSKDGTVLHVNELDLMSNENHLKPCWCECHHTKQEKDIQFKNKVDACKREKADGANCREISTVVPQNESETVSGMGSYLPLEKTPVTTPTRRMYQSVPCGDSSTSTGVKYASLPASSSSSHSRRNTADEFCKDIVIDEYGALLDSMEDDFFFEDI